MNTEDLENKLEIKELVNYYLNKDIIHENRECYEETTTEYQTTERLEDMFKIIELTKCPSLKQDISDIYITELKKQFGHEYHKTGYFVNLKSHWNGYMKDLGYKRK